MSARFASLGAAATLALSGLALGVPMATAAPSAAIAQTVTAAPSLSGGGWDPQHGPYAAFPRVAQDNILHGGWAKDLADRCAGSSSRDCTNAAVVIRAYRHLAANGVCPSSAPDLRVYIWSSLTQCRA